MKTKLVPLRVKAAGPDDGLEEGEFLGYASVFGNVDSYGDVVVKGAFEVTLLEWKGSDNALPVLWGHDMQDPFANIGEAVEYSEDDHGLLVKGRLDLDNPKALQVYRLIKGRRVNQMSFAYDVLEGSWVEEKDEVGNWKDGYYELRKLKLYEVSIVPIGANQETELLGVKSALDILDGIKAGRVLSSKNEQVLKSAYEELTGAAKSIGEVLAQVASTDDEEKASTAQGAKSEEPETVKDEEHSEEVSVDSESAEENPSDEDLFLELEILRLSSPAERQEL